MQLIRHDPTLLAGWPGGGPVGAGSADYFASRSWAETQIATCLDAGEAACVLALGQPGAAPSLLLPLRLPKRARLLPGAREVAAFVTPYSTVCSPIAAPGIDAAEAAAALAAGFRAACPGTDYLVFEALAEEGPWLAAFRQAFDGAGFFLREFEHFGNWYRQTEGLSWHELRAGLPAQLRNTLDRKGRRLSGGHDGRFTLFAAPDEAARARAAYEMVYARSWKVAEPYPRFIGALIESAAQAGALRLGLLEIDGAPAAAQIWIVSGGRATIFKLAHDERGKALSPGSLLTAWMMERVLTEDRPVEIDFGRGDDSYKKDWLPCRRARRGLIAFDPRRPLGLAGAALERGRAAVRSLLARGQRANHAVG
ncbi:MAG: GNAT family N-acetyltransferase [Alphaproteobacteria bacterium]|nr:GNAT family N-acetyltransferase [Alphaproteobacteria bacterium]